jgi:hypothetical protein
VSTEKLRRPCACRVLIESDPDPESVEHAVRVHQAEPEHIRYAVLEQLKGEYVAPQDVALPTTAEVLQRLARAERRLAISGRLS